MVVLIGCVSRLGSASRRAGGMEWRGGERVYCFGMQAISSWYILRMWLRVSLVMIAFPLITATSGYVKTGQRLIDRLATPNTFSTICFPICTVAKRCRLGARTSSFQFHNFDPSPTPAYARIVGSASNTTRPRPSIFIAWSGRPQYVPRVPDKLLFFSLPKCADTSIAFDDFL